MENKRITQLTESAQTARKNAHAPYSGFHVGAAVLTTEESIFAGCNVENAAYPLGQCAEATAIGAMVASGATKIEAIVISSPNDDLCFPCGGCRQKIAEFADDDTPVILVTDCGKQETYTVGELLPHAFRFSHLSANKEKA
ncbi:cytidine deaminase [Alteromonas confluentis]|uniref:Cytidine deaminase n=1 Tax=Alteromonas confluentis TaxID=1656094 RepID=A0A1E7ZE36_9ALTE|nr:cytidine deaminase [Alteromonas confluentis]OFC71765.1 cytidine deaminase [Alteromonas confluentis]